MPAFLYDCPPFFPHQDSGGSERRVDEDAKFSFVSFPTRLLCFGCVFYWMPSLGRETLLSTRAVLLFLSLCRAGCVDMGNRWRRWVGRLDVDELELGFVTR